MISKNIYTSEFYDILEVQFNIEKTHTLNIIAIYRFPNKKFEPFHNILETILSTYPANKKPIILGDFNIDILKKSPHQLNLIETMTRHELRIINTLPTTIYNSLLDHIWVEKRIEILYTNNYPIYWSDHDAPHVLLPKAELSKTK